jgi:MFS family permease
MISNKGKGLSFDWILENRIKIGQCQLWSLLAVCMIWMSDGSEMFIIGFIMPLAQKEWGLTDFETNYLGTGVFLGITLGAIVSGLVADKKGRRIPMLLGATCIMISSFSSIFSPNFLSLIFFRISFGFGMGFSVPITATYVSEIFPKDCRGKYFLWSG